MSDEKSNNSVITPTTINVAQNRVNDNAGHNWATTISRYLLQRREQTQMAYQGQLVSHAFKEDNDSNAWLSETLFATLFEILVQRLEEGHTVLVLDACKSEINANTPSDDNNNDNDNDAGLFAWQRQLWQPLRQALWAALADTSVDMLADTAMTDSSANEWLENDAVWHMVMRQSLLPMYDKQILEQRRTACITLYHSLKHMAANATSTENSLSKFIELLSKNPLFSKNSHEEDKNSSSSRLARPIVFQTTETSNHEILKITLWLHRTWQAEYALAQHIMRIKNQTLTELPITLNPLLNPEQQTAIHMANRSAFSIITGGPGTGKTFTVAQLVIALQQTQSKKDQAKAKANLALAAPTGKAAQRMQESLQDAIEQAGVAMQLPEAKTIHRLLGIGQGGRPRYHKDNPLSEDIIIVDEASMLGVELANHLVSAIKPNARLILLGDANQLAAVDAGAVLADLCRIPTLQNVHQRLVSSRRFKDDSGIGRLARLINQANENYPNAHIHTQNMTAVWQLLQEDAALNFYHLATRINDGKNSEVTSKQTANSSTINSLSKYEFYKKVLNNYTQYFNRTKKILTKIKKAKSIPIKESIDDFTKLMTLLNQFRILTAGHHGWCGDHQINHYLSEQHKAQLKLPLSKSSWYHGRPVMVLQNNYELGLFNGDIGICLQTEKGRLQVFFENKNRGININMLSDEMIATAYAMTIHKSQGSEFDHVAISFDDGNGRLLSQELIYTAVTRAKKQVSIFSTASALTRALSTPTMRQTGLTLQFENVME